MRERMFSYPREFERIAASAARRVPGTVIGIQSSSTCCSVTRSG